MSLPGTEKRNLPRTAEGQTRAKNLPTTMNLADRHREGSFNDPVFAGAQLGSGPVFRLSDQTVELFGIGHHSQKYPLVSLRQRPFLGKSKWQPERRARFSRQRFAPKGRSEVWCS